MPRNRAFEQQLLEALASATPPLPPFVSVYRLTPEQRDRVRYGQTTIGDRDRVLVLIVPEEIVMDDSAWCALRDELAYVYKNNMINIPLLICLPRGMEGQAYLPRVDDLDERQMNALGWYRAIDLDGHRLTADSVQTAAEALGRHRGKGLRTMLKKDNP